MTKDIARFFVLFFHKQVFSSLKHWGVVFLLVVFLVVGVLFSGYIDSFKKLYINNLKGLYPNVYIETQGRQTKALIPEISLEKEIFRVSQFFRFRFKPAGTDVVLVDVGIRAAAPRHLDEIINKQQAGNSESNTVWVNDGLWQKLTKSSAFDGRGVYLKTRDQRYEYVEIRKFDLIGQTGKDWLVMRNQMARKLGMLFNIAGLYPDNSADMESIEDAYASQGLRVFRWSERLPFLNIVIYKLGLHLYAVFMVATIFLIAFLLLSVFHDMLMEFKKVIKFSVVYGLSESLIFLVFTGFSLVYAIGCHAIAGGALVVLKTGLTGVLPLVESISAFHYILYSLLILLPVVIALNVYAVFRVHREGYVSIED